MTIDMTKPLDVYVVNELNAYLADTAVLYIKLHNLHWNVIGKDFKPIHDYTESLYEALATVLDDVAEIIKMHDLQPLASLHDYSAAATIQELHSKPIPSNDVLQLIQIDLKAMKGKAEAIRKAAADEDVYDVVSLMEDHLKEYNKQLWFISSMLK